MKIYSKQRAILALSEISNDLIEANFEFLESLFAVA